MKKGLNIELAALLFTLFLIACVAAAGILNDLRVRDIPEEEFCTEVNETVALPEEPRNYVAVMDLADEGRDTRKFLYGYAYHLLTLFSRENGINCRIEMARDHADPFRELREGAIDILVLPMSDSLVIDSLLVSMPVDSCCLWVMNSGRGDDMLNANVWIENYPYSDDYLEGSEAFRHAYDPFRSRPRSRISPYDDIIRRNASTLGWDWRYLAAIIYQESHFRIDARSSRGALGLMQIIPDSADMYGSYDLLDPEQNIELGTRMLKKTAGYFKGVAANTDECVKMTLAAYNAGPGRVFDCIELARSEGISPSSWENLVSVIPMMRDSSILDNPNIRCGVFQGYETIAYVRRVNSIYRRFCNICPEEE